jgi:oxygen-independent coproporphyrinogen-3 oxidase
MQQTVFDREIIARCQTNAPRYTSYPTADRFNLEFGPSAQQEQIKQVLVNTEDVPAISLYIHIPFCNTLCLFCACNKVITNNRNRITEYLTYLEQELVLYHKLIGKRLKVVQLHFGGGSPSWLSCAQLQDLMQMIRKYFDLSHAQEIAMELDPRHVSDEFMDTLAEQGFNRISLGVQDFDAAVQKAVNRIQSLEDTQQVLKKAVALGFKSTNIDLIYGLPLQTLASFSKTIDTVIHVLAPARIALFNYAHLPQLFMPQTRINAHDLPGASEKLDLFQMCVSRLNAAGYLFIGMDHFAKADDELALALNNGTLQRNFQGYSTWADTHMLSFGVSAIGFIGNSYYQNAKDLDHYYSALKQGQLPLFRGVSLTSDDLLRRAIIQKIMCEFKLDFKQINVNYKIQFAEYFTIELVKLRELHDLGLIDLRPFGLVVSTKGRFLIRNVAKVFDKYLRVAPNPNSYSQSI